MKNTPPKIVVLIGPTSAGKSDLAILLAKKYNGEIISVDSRQVYRGMDLGSGKVTKREQKLARHHLLDVASPKRTYNVSHFLRDAKKRMTEIEKRGHLPILCGGTHFWIQALLENAELPAVKPDKKLRKHLETLSTEKLFTLLAQQDAIRAASIDPKNKVRLIRALEIVAALEKVPRLTSNAQHHMKNTLIIALLPDKKTLRRNIHLRLHKRFRQGMITEVQRLRTEGVSLKRLETFGLEYRAIARFLQKKITRAEMEQQLETEIWHFAKRQLSYLRRMEKQGFSLHKITTPEEALTLLSKFLSE